MITLGVDVGGTSVKLACRDGNRLLWTGQSPFYAKPTTEQLVEAIWAAAAGRFTGVEATGLCVPGLLDRQKRMITLSVNVPGLMNIVLDELLARALGPGLGPVHILSDAVSTAWDVVSERGLAGRTYAFVIGTGVGAGVLDDGVPLFINMGVSPGHIGQVDVSVEGHPVIGPDGGAGSLEGYLGVPAMKKLYGVDDLGPVLAKMTADDVPMRALAKAIRIVHGIYRPNHVLLLGGIGIRLKHVVPGLKERVSTNLTRVAREGWTLSTGDSDFHASSGASKLAAREAAR